MGFFVSSYGRKRFYHEKKRKRKKPYCRIGRDSASKRLYAPVFPAKIIDQGCVRKYHELPTTKMPTIITIKGRIVFKAWLSPIYCDVERYNYNETTGKSHRPALNRHAYDGTELIKYDPVLQRKGIRYIFDYNNRFSKIVQNLSAKAKRSSSLIAIPTRLPTHPTNISLLIPMCASDMKRITVLSPLRP